jgi:hypothetical protein
MNSFAAGRSRLRTYVLITLWSLRYQALSAQLARVGLTAAGLDEDSHQAIRQQYRDGLDIFSKTARPGSSTAHLRPSRRRMLTGVQDSSPDHVNFDSLQIGPTPSLPLTLGPYVAQPPLFGTRYTQDFEELGILGKGGYGIVFQCRHKLDGVIYAVKKVPVSERRRQQILIRGQPEVDDLLSELRTLAQLDHPNIVRYFNGWLDYMNLGNSLDESSNSVTDAEDSRTGSFSRGRIIAEASEDHIMFENSVSLPLIIPSNVSQRQPGLKSSRSPMSSPQDLQESRRHAALNSSLSALNSDRTELKADSITSANHGIQLRCNFAHLSRPHL